MQPIRSASRVIGAVSRSQVRTFAVGRPASMAKEGRLAKHASTYVTNDGNLRSNKELSNAEKAHATTAWKDMQENPATSSDSDWLTKATEQEAKQKFESNKEFVTSQFKSNDKPRNASNMPSSFSKKHDEDSELGFTNTMEEVKPSATPVRENSSDSQLFSDETKETMKKTAKDAKVAVKQTARDIKASARNVKESVSEKIDENSLSNTAQNLKQAAKDMSATAKDRIEAATADLLGPNATEKAETALGNAWEKTKDVAAAAADNAKLAAVNAGQAIGDKLHMNEPDHPVGQTLNTAKNAAVAGYEAGKETAVDQKEELKTAGNEFVQGSMVLTKAAARFLNVGADVVWQGIKASTQTVAGTAAGSKKD